MPAWTLPAFGLLLAAALIAAAVLALRWWRTHSDIRIAMPATGRPGVRFGYYGCWGNQVAETAGHASLLWAIPFEGPDKLIADILAARTFTVLDLSAQLFTSSGRWSHTYADGAQASLRNWLLTLRQRGALRYVRALVPIDEPNATTTPEHLARAIATIRQVAAEFPELAGYQLAAIYGLGDYPLIAEFDLVGIDKYSAKSSLLRAGGAHERMRAQLKPGAQTLLVPGGAYGQNPQPFLAYAMRHPDVAAIVTFTWASVRDGKDRITGVRDQPAVRAQYEQCGRTLLQLLEPPAAPPAP